MCRQAVGGIFAQLERLGAGLFMHLTHSGGRGPSLTVFVAIASSLWLYRNHHLAGRQRRGRAARPTRFAPPPSSAGGFWDSASAESSCASVHVAQAFAPSLKPRPQARASERVALYSRSPSSLPSLVDRNHSSKAGASCLRYPFNPKNPAPPKATARS